jgi:hypothetical protein
MRGSTCLLVGLSLLGASVTAQFQFFDQMFNNGQEQHPPGPVPDGPSEPAWYQQQVHHGECLYALHPVLVRMALQIFGFQVWGSSRNIYSLRPPHHRGLLKQRNILWLPIMRWRWGFAQFNSYR